MSIQIIPSLSGNLSHAHQMLESIVLRTNEGAVFKIEIGKSIRPETDGLIGAKVSQLSTDTQLHIGVCIGESVDQVATAAQELINTAIETGDASVESSIPKPHMLNAARSRSGSVSS